MKALLLAVLLAGCACAQEQSSLLPSEPAFGKVPAYHRISAEQRLNWFVENTAGPISLLAVGPVSAAWGTAYNSPKEYGTHWDGYAKRYGMRLTGVSVGNAMEAGLGAIWGEDPRYFRSHDKGFKKRTFYVIKASFMAPGPDGNFRPAYARYAGNFGNNFLSNTWRVPSDSTASRASLRCLYGTLGELGGNAFTEFWPDIKAKVFRRR
jgi:hypothetical protein